jgi:hypothetical protein
MEINYKKNLNPTLFNENNKNLLDLKKKFKSNFI